MPDIEETQEKSQNSLLLSRYKDGLNADRENPKERARLFKLIFSQDIFKPNGFLDQEVVRGKVLDLGCGRGGLGIFLKKVNPEIKIAGCDLVDYSDRGLVSDSYSEIHQSDVTAFLQEVKNSGKKFDFIISCGLPFETIEEMIEKIDFGEVLGKEGHVLFLVDYPIDKPTAIVAGNKGFDLKFGKFPIDQSILVYPKK